MSSPCPETGEFGSLSIRENADGNKDCISTLENACSVNPPKKWPFIRLMLGDIVSNFRRQKSQRKVSTRPYEPTDRRNRIFIESVVWFRTECHVAFVFCAFVKKVKATRVIVRGSCDLNIVKFWNRYQIPLHDLMWHFMLDYEPIRVLNILHNYCPPKRVRSQLCSFVCDYVNTWWQIFGAASRDEVI